MTMFNQNLDKSNFRLKALELLCRMATDIYIASRNQGGQFISEKDAVISAGKIYNNVKDQMIIKETPD